jgi:hypothetical protein
MSTRASIDAGALGLSLRVPALALRPDAGRPREAGGRGSAARRRPFPTIAVGQAEPRAVHRREIVLSALATAIYRRAWDFMGHNRACDRRRAKLKRRHCDERRLQYRWLYAELPRGFASRE